MVIMMTKVEEGVHGDLMMMIIIIIIIIKIMIVMMLKMVIIMTMITKVEEGVHGDLPQGHSRRDALPNLCRTYFSGVFLVQDRNDDDDDCDDYNANYDDKSLVTTFVGLTFQVVSHRDIDH